MEFTEVFKNAQRMCKYYEFECGNCPLCCNNGCSLPPWKGKAGDEIERRVMDWATEHPEPQYPTWWEWLADKGIVPAEVKASVAYELNKTGLVNPIPTDIAEKLGLKPKEAANNAGH